MSAARRKKMRPRTTSVGTVIGITLVLCMLGIQGFILLNARALERYFKEQVRVELFLKRELKETDVMRFRKELDVQPWSAGTVLVTPEEAAAAMKQELGEDFLELLGGVSPIDPNIQLSIKPAYAHPDSMRWIVEGLRNDARLHDVAYNAAVIENMDRNFVTLNLGGFVFLALLLVVAMALINNTIRLAVHSQRFLIRTMHLVGATKWFIKRPFLLSGLWQGLIATALAIGGLIGLLWLGKRYVPDLLAFTDAWSLGLLFGGVVLVGLLIALLATWIAVGRYLRMDHEALHWS
ncbi:MAG: cell division protein FtsX [Flavobacteriales bacterium]|nr:cell division protein FtsX [Flavobacteriales bacterium]